MRVAVIGSPESWYLSDLKRAGGTVHEVVAVPFARIQSHIDPDGDVRVCGGNVDFADFDCLLVRTMPLGTLEQVVFRMDVLGRWQATGRPVINSPRALEVSVDKYLALAKLHAAGLRVPRTIVCQTEHEAQDGFEQLGGDVVIKPLFGSEGRGIVRISDATLASRAFKMLAHMGAVVYIQEFVEHEGFDLRLLVLGERVLGMRRRNACDWRTNVSRGAVAEPIEVDDSLAQIARKAADAVGAELAGVDLLPARDGRLLAIEINAVPGWKALARTLQQDVAALVLRHLDSAVKASGR